MLKRARVGTPKSAFEPRPGTSSNSWGLKAVLQTCLWAPQNGPKTRRLLIIRLRVQEAHCTKDAARNKKRWRHRTSRRHLGQYFYLFFQLNGCQTASLTVLHHERFRPSDLLASWERAPIGCCWKGWINCLATNVILTEMKRI